MPRHTEPLSDTAIRNAKPKDVAFKLFDGGGLFLLVTPTGGKLWRLKYRFGGTEKLLSLGVYPPLGFKTPANAAKKPKRRLPGGLIPQRINRPSRPLYGQKRKTPLRLLPANGLLKIKPHGWIRIRKRLSAAWKIIFFPLSGGNPSTR